MYLKKWNELPRFMKNEKVRPYYDCLSKKTFSLKLKRAFDFVVALIMLVLLFVPMLIIAIMNTESMNCACLVLIITPPY